MFVAVLCFTPLCPIYILGHKVGRADLDVLGLRGQESLEAGYVVACELVLESDEIDVDDVAGIMLEVSDAISHPAANETNPTLITNVTLSKLQPREELIFLRVHDLEVVVIERDAGGNEIRVPANRFQIDIRE